MTKSAARLSLGALPRAEVTKLTITLSADLKEQLDAYAQAHSKLYGSVDAATLVPHMLATFMARDRGFRKTSQSPTKKTSGTADD